MVTPAFYEIPEIHGRWVLMRHLSIVLGIESKSIAEKYLPQIRSDKGELKIVLPDAYDGWFFGFVDNLGLLFFRGK